ncbi:MAG TPA: hypothetical protein VEA37_05810, partial [Flavobacterium sp.]|nr:hypothetical protein [Flavobacterium sp.]
YGKDKKALGLARVKSAWVSAHKRGEFAAPIRPNGDKPLFLAETERHVTATILNKLNQKYSGRDRIDTDDSIRVIKYSDAGFEGKVRPYFFEKFRKDPLYGDRIFYLLISILTREGKLVRMRNVFNEVGRRVKYSLGETLDNVLNDALKSLRPIYANYLHTRGRSREIMPRPVTFHQAVSLSLRFFKRKIISRDSRNAALKSIKIALTNEVESHFADYKVRNAFFEEYVEQSKHNAYLVAGLKAARERLENERIKEYQTAVNALADEKERPVRRRPVSIKVLEQKKLYSVKRKMVSAKVDLRYSDKKSIAELAAFDEELARKRGQLGNRRRKRTKRKNGPL